MKFVPAVVSDMQLSVSTIQFPDDVDFIRGYNTTIEFNFTLTNLETNLAVDAGVNNTANYDVTVLTAYPAQPASRRRRDVSADLDTIVTQSSQFPDDQLAQRLDYGSEITVTGEVIAMIESATKKGGITTESLLEESTCETLIAVTNNMFVRPKWETLARCSCHFVEDRHTGLTMK